MKTREGQIITVYNHDDNDASWDYQHIIVDPISKILLVVASEMPLDYEKHIKSVYVLIETDDNYNIIFDENDRVTLIRKTMNLRNVLAFYCPSNEIKQRIKNGQIKINNIPIKSLDVEVDFYDEGPSTELPDFLTTCGINLKQLTLLKGYTGLNICDFFGSPTLEEGPTNIPQFEFLRGFVLLTLSKREHYVYVNNELNCDIPYSITDINS